MGTTAGRLAGLEGKIGISPDHLILESSLLKWREEILPKIHKEFPEQQLTPEAIIEALSADQPVAGLITQIPNMKLLTEAVGGFIKAVSSISTISDGFKPWFNSSSPGNPAEGHDEKITDWFAASWQGDRTRIDALSSKTGVEADLLEWAGNQIIRPFFHRLGELLAVHQPTDTVAKMTVGCPCCGGPPRMGRYARDEGRRYLWCDLCNIQWVFRRVTCPFCLNADHEKLSFLTVDGIDNYRVDVCRVCKGYLRSIDERGLSEDHRTDYLLEDVGTLHLCMAAEKEGWQQGVILSDKE